MSRMVAEVIAMVSATVHGQRSLDRSAQRRLVLLVTALLTAATAVVLASAATSIPSPGVPVDQSDDTAVLVRRFYSAANKVLTSGDTSDLIAVLSSDTGTVPESARVEPGLDGLANRLVVLHATQPLLQLIVEEVVTDGEAAVARIALAGETASASLVRPEVTGTGRLLDEFRVQGGRIIEVSGATASLAAPTVVLSAEVMPLKTETVLVSLAHLTLAPGGEIPTLVGRGPIALAVETGTLQTRFDASGRLIRGSFTGDPTVRPVAPGTGLMLRSGDQLSVGAGAPLGLRNDESEPAVVLIVAVFPPSAADPVQFENPGMPDHSIASSLVIGQGDNNRDIVWSDGITVRAIGTGTMSVKPSERLNITAARTVLPPGAELRAVPKGMMLVAMLDGSAVLMMGDNDRHGSPASQALVVTTEEAVVVPAGHTVRLHGLGDEPITAMLLSLDPLATGAATST